MISILEQRGAVDFPGFDGEKIYMREFNNVDGLPRKWRDTVSQMLDGIDVVGPKYLMVDESFVAAGEFHRRPGVHIDGYWNPGLQCHQRGHTFVPRHKPTSPRHRSTPSHVSGSQRWEDADFREHEGLILASNAFGAKGYVGEFDGRIQDGGDCRSIDVTNLESVDLNPNTVFAGNVTFLHESVPVLEDCYRQLVRINVPGWSPTVH